MCMRGTHTSAWVKLNEALGGPQVHLEAFPTPIQAQPPPLALTSEQRAQLGTLAERQECLDSHKSKEPLCWTGPWLHQLRLLHLPSLSKSSASHTRDHGGRLGVRGGETGSFTSQLTTFLSRQLFRPGQAGRAVLTSRRGPGCLLDTPSVSQE